MTDKIVKNFDVSVILPFFKKLEDFKRILPLNAPYFQRNGIEVIIVMDEPGEEEGVLEFINSYPFINWQVIVNDIAHAWRNPAKALNVGIKHARKQYIMVASPESELYTDAILHLRTALEYYEKSFAIGKVTFSWMDQEAVDTNQCIFLPYGSIMAKKEDLEAVRGYSEQLLKWGGDDDNVRARLEYYGLQELFVDEAVLIHREKKKADRATQPVAPAGNRRLNAVSATDVPSDGGRRRTYPPEEHRRLYFPSSHLTNDENWGKDFDRVAYDYQNRKNARQLCEQYVRQFLQYRIAGPAAFAKPYRIIALARTFNNAATVNDYLSHLDQHADGIILLDDYSTDGTFEVATSEKLLVKVQKQRKEFNDVELLNILLNIGSFFRSDWFYLLDSDERFHDRYNSVYALTELQTAEIILFKLVHLWDSDSHYRADYPASRRGIQEKFRMFKNIGRMQILNNKKLHIVPVPYEGITQGSKVLIKHYGMLSRDARQRKYDFYMHEDRRKDQSDYSHLLSEQVVIEPVAAISL